MLFRTAPSRSSGVVLLLALLLGAAVTALAARQLTGNAEQRQAEQRQAVLEAQVSSVHFLLNRLHYSYTDAVLSTYESGDSDEAHAAKVIEEFNLRYNLGYDPDADTVVNPVALSGRFALTPENLGYEDDGMLAEESCKEELGTPCWGGWMSPGSGSLRSSGFHFYVHFPNALRLRAVLQRMRQDVARQDVVFCAVTPAELRKTLAALENDAEQHYWTFPSEKFPDDSGAEKADCTPEEAEADWAQFSTGNLGEYPGSVLLGTYTLPEEVAARVEEVRITGGGEISLPRIVLRKLAADRLKFYKINVSNKHTDRKSGRYSVHGRDVVRIRRRYDPVEDSSLPMKVSLSGLTSATPQIQQDYGDKQWWGNLYAVSSCYANPWPVQEAFYFRGDGSHSYDAYDGVVVKDRYKPFNCGWWADRPSAPSASEFGTGEWARAPNGKRIKWRYTMLAFNKDMHEHPQAYADEPKIEALTTADVFEAFSFVDTRDGLPIPREIWPNEKQRGDSLDNTSNVLSLASQPQDTRPSDRAAVNGRRPGPNENLNIGLMRHVNSLLGSPTVDPSASRHWPSIDKPMRAWQYHSTQGWQKQSNSVRPLYMPAYQPNCNGNGLGVSNPPETDCSRWLADATSNLLTTTSFLVTRSVAQHLAHQVFAPGVKRRPRFRRGHNVGEDYYVASCLPDGDCMPGQSPYSPADKKQWLPKLKQKDRTSSDDYKDVTRIYGGAAAARMKIHRLYGAVHLRPNFMRSYLDGSTADGENFLHGPPDEASNFAWNWNGTCDAWGEDSALPDYDPMNPDPRLLYTDEYDRDDPSNHSLVRTAITTMEDTPREKTSHPQCPTYLFVHQSAVIFSEALVFDTDTGEDNTAVQFALNTQTERLNELWPTHSERAGTASLGAIRPYSYRPKFAASAFLPESISSGSTEDIGFLAQEIQAYYPEAVFQHKGLLSISYYSLLPALWSHLTEARQRHRQRMAQLTGRIERMRMRLGDAGDCGAGQAGEVCR